MGLSIRTVLGAPGLVAGLVGVRRRMTRRGRLHGGRGNRRVRRWRDERALWSMASQANVDRSRADVKRGQIVALHETNEVVDPLDVEWLGRTRGVLGHAFTPNLQTPSPRPWLASDDQAGGRDSRGECLEAAELINS